MMVKNKIHQRSFREKLVEAIGELRQVMEASGIAAQRYRLAAAQLRAYRALTNSRGAAENIPNTSDVLKNELVSFQKDRIAELERRIATLEAEKESAARARAVAEAESLNDILKAAEEEKKELVREKCSLEYERRRLEEEVKRLNALSDQLKEACNVEADSGEEDPGRSDVAAPLSYQIDTLKEEIEKYREKVLHLGKENAVALRRVKNLEEEESILRGLVEVLEKKALKKEDLDGFGKNGASDDEKGAKNLVWAEMNRMIEAFESAVSNAKDLEKRLGYVHRKNEELFSENACLKTQIKLGEDSRHALDRERRRCEAAKAEARSELEKMIDKERELEEKSRKMAKENDGAKRRALAAEAQTKSLQDEVYQLRKDVSSMTQELSAAKALVKDKESVIRRQNIIISMLKKECGAFEDKEVEDVEMYRKIVRCALCDSNLKNCVITNCMHCFCEDCIKNRYNVRKRRCPTCDMQFTMKDVKRIYF